MHANHPVWDNGTSPQTCHLGVFQYIFNLSARKYGKHSIWKKKTLPNFGKRKDINRKVYYYCCCFFKLLFYQNPKIHEQQSISRNTTLLKTYIMRFFSRC